MVDVVIVDAARTPVGKRNGWLREQHPVKLGAHAIKAAMARAGITADQVDHVVFGCVSQVSEQTFNIARNVVLEVGLPIEVPATTVDFQCGSSQQAVHLAAAMVASGQADVVLAGGVESMTRVPMGSSMAGGQPFTDNIMEEHNMVNQGIASDEIAAKWGITRSELDDLGYQSHIRAAKATEAGYLQREIAPIEGVDKEGNLFTVEHDQGFRANANREKMNDLQPAFSQEGVTTAGNSSQISDGAAALVVMTADKAKELGLKPRAKIVASVTVGSDPHLMLTGPVPATKKALERAGLSMDDIDIFEVNEAFATVVKMWEKEMNADMEKVNVFGGAVALGHPLGGSGARLMTTLLNALDINDGKFGLQTMCCGGGMATGTIVERLNGAD
ncbi:MAG: thiolase family protein [Anaerolineae bacterium]|nr:thiolase family protein [Anaerolineae bacterium]